MNDQIFNFIANPDRLTPFRATLAQCAAAPDDAPLGLPGPFYSDEAYFQHECATVLRQGWHCVARADELPEQGDFLTLDLLGEPLIVVRDNGQIKVLSNVCRHRGMPVAEGQGNAKRFVCRYHAWTYATDGALLRSPRMKNSSFDPKGCHLGKFHSAERFGFIYINLSSQPSAIDDDFKGLSEVISRYEPENFRIVHSAAEVWNCNWKCLVENFMEGYHLSVVHPQTLHGYTPTGLSKKGPNGAGFTTYFANYPDSADQRGDGAPGLDAAARRRSSLFAAFPCQVASVSASLLVSLSIRPLSATSIEVRWTMSTYDDNLDPAVIKQRIALWNEVNREDREKLEAMQRALRSVHAVGGPLAGDDYEGTVRDFVRWLARQDSVQA